MDLPAIYHRHDSEKKRQYSQRVKEVEHGVFTPLVFSTTGGMARECSTFYRGLADMISIKQNKPYSLVVSWLHTRLSYASLHTAFMEAGHHITTLFTNMTLPLLLLRVRYHPQSKILSVTLLFLCIV